MNFSDWLALNSNKIDLKFYNEKSTTEPPLWIDQWSKTKIENEGFSTNSYGEY